jgi:hypothetical protein
VQLAPYQLIGRNGIHPCYPRLVVARAVPLPEMQAPAAEADVDWEVAGFPSWRPMIFQPMC